MANRKVPIIRSKEGMINVDETLYSQRHLFITDAIDDDMADGLIKDLLVLDMINNQPIQMYINSPGGSVSAGFAIIDVMQRIKSPVITIASGNVASMATIIAMSGNERKAFKNSIAMLHDMFAGSVDYVSKMKDRVNFLESYQAKLMTHVKKHTKLTDDEITKAFAGELWLDAQQALEKGLFDVII